MELHWSVWVHVMYFDSTQAAQEAELYRDWLLFWWVHCLVKDLFFSMDSLDTILEISMTFLRLSTFLIFESVGLFNLREVSCQRGVISTCDMTELRFSAQIKKNKKKTMEQQQLKKQRQRTGFSPFWGVHWLTETHIIVRKQWSGELCRK